MANRPAGSGGFVLPQIYTHQQQATLACLQRGEVDYADLSQWSFADEFLCFILQTKFLEFADRTYPNPRKKNLVPVWFLVASQLVLRCHNRRHYHDLRYFLNAGSILTKVGLNTSARGVVGFNDKNTYERKTACDPDTVRKYFKDTDPARIRSWYNETLQRWFKGHKVYDQTGLFILDQSHLVVPDNPHYHDAKKMPVNEHGQFYKHVDLKSLTAEQKQALVYHPCYALSCLLHVAPSGDLFHISGYDFGPGDTDELIQADAVVPPFCQMHPGVMKELIVDRGYISGPFVADLKQTYGVDVLIPLKRSMNDFQDALSIAQRKNAWVTTEREEDQNGRVIKETQTTLVEKMDLWEACPLSLNVYVSRTQRWNKKTQTFESYHWALAATKRYPHEAAAIARYALRTQVEERFKQLKCFYHLADFTSPATGLMESHLCFVLLTYSLLQLYLRRNSLRELTHRLIDTLRKQEQLGHDAVVVYAGDAFGVLNLDDYSLILIELDPEPKQKLKALMLKQREVRKTRHSSPRFAR